jgi:MerR family transcriptional regulator, copper efflux regulator
MTAFTIGKLAEAAGVHVETIRYYERRGLLAPPPRSASGYRQYSPDDLWRLQFIARGKRLGFTLAEIAEVMSPASSPDSGSPSASGSASAAGSASASASASLERVLEAARAKIAAIDERQRELARMRCRLQQLAELCEHGPDADCLALRVAG